jgi:hypothetical protein
VERIAPPEREVGKLRLLRHFANRGGERRLARLDDALREIPVAERPEQQAAPAIRVSPHDDSAGGTARHGTVIFCHSGGLAYAVW